ncbi:MAG: hypothetical protein ACOZJX_13265 [Pseudomonadota bacterium]
MPTLPAEWLPHFTDGVSHRIGSCTAAGEPCLCAALAADLLDDGRVLVLLGAHAGRDVLAAIRETGQVAVVLGQPLSHRTLHLKGSDAEVLPAEPAHAALVEARRAAFSQALVPFGFCHEQVATWYAVRETGLMTVRFTPIGAWNQTPGPGAGQAVELLR